MEPNFYENKSPHDTLNDFYRICYFPELIVFLIINQPAIINNFLQLEIVFSETPSLSLYIVYMVYII